MTGRIAGSAETISGTLRTFFTAEEIAARDGFLQSRDPRVSVVAIAGLALATMISRTILVHATLAALTLALAWRSAVPIRRLLRRSAIVPLASAMVVLPQIVLMPGDPLVSTLDLTITGAGVTYVAMFTLRVGVGVALLSLLVLTTPFSVVIAAMHDLRIPTAIVWVVAITYRYLFLFFDELQRLILARNSRTTGDLGVRAGWRDARRIAGTFLLRTLDRGERVGRGMRARGGSRPPTPYSRARSIDAADWLLVATALVAVTGSGVVRWIL